MPVVTRAGKVEKDVGVGHALLPVAWDLAAFGVYQAPQKKLADPFRDGPAIYDERWPLLLRPGGEALLDFQRFAKPRNVVQFVALAFVEQVQSEAGNDRLFGGPGADRQIQ